MTDPRVVAAGSDVDQRIAAIDGEIDRACAAVEAMCNGGRWRMSIPAQPDVDSDLVISKALGSALWLLATLRETRAQLADAHKVIDMQSIEFNEAEDDGEFEY